MCPKNKEACRQNGKCNGKNGQRKEGDTEIVELQDVGSQERISLQDGGTWYQVLEKREIFEILDMCEDSDYMLVGGNTGQGKSGSWWHLYSSICGLFSGSRENDRTDFLGF